MNFDEGQLDPGSVDAVVGEAAMFDECGLKAYVARRDRLVQSRLLHEADWSGLGCSGLDEALLLLTITAAPDDRAPAEHHDQFIAWVELRRVRAGGVILRSTTSRARWSIRPSIWHVARYFSRIVSNDIKARRVGVLAHRKLMWPTGRS